MDIYYLGDLIMSFIKELDKYEGFDYESFFIGIKNKQIEKILKKQTISTMDYLALLSPIAQEYLEEMAVKASSITRKFFGRTILLYTPMYLSNYCTNQCAYCSFHKDNTISRRKLTTEEIEKESINIKELGFKHILLLTGDDRLNSGIDYLEKSIKIIKRYFPSVSLEVYSLSQEEYNKMAEIGVDGLTVYQETYNRNIYSQVHPKGPKSNYEYRLDAPERACMAGIRTVNIGALLGLDDWRKEAFYTGIHASYLQNKYLDTEISISFPRLRPYSGSFQPNSIVEDKDLVQMILAARIYLNRAGITISTRESEYLRNNLINLGVTKMSAGSMTSVGGHLDNENKEAQFEISDTRCVEDFYKAIKKSGFQPIFKDWYA